MMKVKNKDLNRITEKNTNSKQNIPVIMSCEMYLIPPNAHLPMARQKSTFLMNPPLKN